MRNGDNARPAVVVACQAMNGFSLLRLKLDEVIVVFRQDIDDRVDDDVGLAESSRCCRL
ncbi:MAG: hypothetical protein ACYDFS_11090 [Vulcanimicrobiaceae bacterium]